MKVVAEESFTASDEIIVIVNSMNSESKVYGYVKIVGKTKRDWVVTLHHREYKNEIKYYLPYFLTQGEILQMCEFIEMDNITGIHETLLAMTPNSSRPILVPSPLEVTSSNFYLIYPQIPLQYKLISVLVNIIQVALLVASTSFHLHRHSSGTDPNGAANEIDNYLLLFAVYPFVALYLSSIISDTLSKEYLELFGGDIYDNVSKQEGEVVKNLTILICTPIAVITAVIACYFLPVYYLYRGISVKYAFASLAISFEFTMQATTIYALVQIVRSQTSVIDILFNCAGLLVILDLDDALGRMIHYTIEQKRVRLSDEDENEAAMRTSERSQTNAKLSYFLLLAVIIFITLASGLFKHSGSQ
jgi:hypothetical protein